MVAIHVKPTRREAEAQRQEVLSRRGLSLTRYRGTARCVEEAVELQRGLGREGEKFDKLWSCAGPEAKQAEQDVLLKSNINPETMEKM